jgi:hypothetical protein
VCTAGCEEITVGDHGWLPARDEGGGGVGSVTTMVSRDKKRPQKKMPGGTKTPGGINI